MWGTGATAKALQDYAQNFASSEYGNIYNRNLNTYQTNYQNLLNAYTTNLAQAQNQYATNAQTQFLQPYQIAFQNAQAAFAPQMTQYQTQAAAAAQQNQLNYENAYRMWLDSFNQRLAQGQFGLQTQLA